VGPLGATAAEVRFVSGGQGPPLAIRLDPPNETAEEAVPLGSVGHVLSALERDGEPGIVSPKRTPRWV
jgi:hypothetical protein